MMQQDRVIRTESIAGRYARLLPSRGAGYGKHHIIACTNSSAARSQ